MTTVDILHDDRPIDAAHVFDGPSYHVGAFNVEKIEAYGESGEYARIAWLAIHRNGQVIARFPASKALIEYK